MFYKKSISRQLFLIFFIIYAFLLIVFNSGLEYGLRRYFLNDFKRSAKKIVQLMTNQTELLFESVDESIKIIKSSFETVQMNSREIDLLLMKLKLMNDSYEYISILDIHGTEVYSSEESIKEMIDLNDNILKQLENGEIFKSNVFIDAHHSPMIRVYIPVFHLSKMKNIIYMEISFRSLWDNMDHISSQSDGVFYLISEDGVLCSYYDKHWVYKNDGEKVKQLIDNALKSALEPMVVKLKGEEKFLLSSKKLSNLNYYLVYQLDISFLMSQMKKLKYMLYSLTILIMIIAFMVISQVSNKISFPLKYLAKELSKIGREKINRLKGIEKRKDEVSNLYEHVIEMNDELLSAKAREKLAIIGESAMGISHEIKNPLQSIKNYIDLHIIEPDNQEIMDDFKSVVPNELARIQTMLEDLSELHLGANLEKSDCDLISIINDAALVFKLTLEKNKIQMHKGFSCKNLKIHADSDKLKSVFINLIQNSSQAIKSDGQIFISLKTIDDRNIKKAVICFKDTGPGIPREIVDKVFNPFYSTKKKGLGIGLALCKGIIEQHGGNISIRQEKGHGAQFIIEIPY